MAHAAARCACMCVAQRQRATRKSGTAVAEPGQHQQAGRRTHGVLSGRAESLAPKKRVTSLVLLPSHLRTPHMGRGMCHARWAKDGMLVACLPAGCAALCTRPHPSNVSCSRCSAHLLLYPLRPRFTTSTCACQTAQIFIETRSSRPGGSWRLVSGRGQTQVAACAGRQAAPDACTLRL